MTERETLNKLRQLTKTLLAVSAAPMANTPAWRVIEELIECISKTLEKL